MAMSSLRSIVRMAMRARTFPSSPAIYGPRNALFNVVDGRSILDVALSGFAGSRGAHSRAQPRRRRARASVPGAVTRRRASLPRPQGSSLGSAAPGRGARRLHVSRDGHGDVAFAAMTVAASSAFAGVWYWMKHTDKQPALYDEDEDPAMKKDAYLRRVQLGKDRQRARASYYKKQAMVEEEEEEEDTEEDDPAMRARFADWMEEYGRTYPDEEEKARRFKLFKACAREVDAANAEAAESGASTRYGLNNFADWNAQEFSFLCGELADDLSETISDDEYTFSDDEYLGEEMKNTRSRKSRN